MAEGSIDKLSISIGASSAKAVTNITNLADALQKLRVAVSVIDSGSAQKIQGLATALGSLKGVGALTGLNKVPEQLQNIAIAVGSISEDTISKIDRLTSALSKLKGVNVTGAGKLLDKNPGPYSAAAGLSPNISKTSETGGGLMGETAEKAKEAASGLKEVERSSKGAASGIKDVGNAAKKATGPLGSFMSALKRIAMYRVMRSIIKAITQAFKEGLENAYQFSAGITSEGHRFATALDSLSTSGLKMKNQLGAAFIGLLSAIAPIINTIIGLVTKLADALSQIFAIFTGGSYLKAADVPKKWADAAGGAGKAAKEWKNQLLGFDEINRLNEPNDGGGGGGGGSALDPSQMFVDTPIDGVFAKIKAKLDELRKSLDFTKLRESWDRLKESVKGFSDAVQTRLGYIWDTYLVPLAHWVIEEAAPVLIDDLAKAFDLLSTIIEKSQPIWEWMDEHFFTPLIKFGEDLELDALEGLGEVLETITRVLNGDQTLTVGDFFDTVEGGLRKIVRFTEPAAALGQVLGEIVGEKIRTAFDEFRKKVNEDIESVKEKFENFKTKVPEYIDKVMGKVDEFKRKFTEKFDAIRDKAQEIIDKVKEFFSFQWQIPHINLPHLRVDWEDIGANSVLARFIGVSAIPHLGIDWYAQGGFPEDGLFMANHNELVGRFSNGRTAVANNEQIVEGIRQGVYEAVTAAMGSGGDRDVQVKVYLDSREIKAGQNRLNRSMGVA